MGERTAPRLSAPLKDPALVPGNAAVYNQAVRRDQPTRTLVGAVLALALSSPVAPTSQTSQTRPSNPAPSGQRESSPAELPRPIVPVAASSLAANPEPYFGEVVSITAAVEEAISPLAFLVDQDRTKRGPGLVLVLARRLNQPVQPNTYVTVVGPLARFDPDAIRQQHPDVPLDLPPSRLEEFRGRPVVLATNVVDASGVDLARRLPPPMTPAEAAYSKTMKTVGEAQAALRKALDASEGRLVQEQAAVLTQAFSQVERFWRGQRRADAVDWARRAAALAESLARGSAEERWDDVKRAATSLAGLCQQCHETYRERFDDGSFRIRLPEATAARTR